jgi:hypothetical protein
VTVATGAPRGDLGVLIGTGTLGMAMSPTAGNSSSTPQTWSARIMSAFTGPGSSGDSEVNTDPVEVLPPGERKAAMSGLDPKESKWSLGAFVLATVGGIALPAYFVAANKVTKDGRNSIAVAPDAELLGGVILVLCVVGFLALWKRKRTLVAFDLFLVGFAFTVFILPFGLAFVFLGGWLMLRAWRINRYGTTNAKAIAREAAARPRGRQRKEAARSASKTPATPGARKPPVASKRYTPKAPPRKKIPKSAE